MSEEIQGLPPIDMIDAGMMMDATVCGSLERAIQAATELQRGLFDVYVSPGERMPWSVPVDCRRAIEWPSVPRGEVWLAKWGCVLCRIFHIPAVGPANGTSPDFKVAVATAYGVSK